MTRIFLNFLYNSRRLNQLSSLILIIIPLLSGSCQKDQLFDFAKRSGKTMTITRPIDGKFTKIFLNDDVNLVITQDTAYEIKLEGGENLLPGIETTLSDSTLTIRNNNTFNWLRSYDQKITAYISLPHLLNLQYNATSTVTNTDTIREDSLSVASIGGSGYINLTIKTHTAKLAITSGSADMNIKGITGLNFIFLGSYGSFHCLDLQSTFLYMRNAGTNDCFVNVAYHFEYEIMGLGNIYYRGNPPEISGTITSEGKLIRYE